jgi:hypothetical protein
VKVEDVRGWLESQLRAAEPSAPTAAQCARIALAALDVADKASDWAFGDGPIGAITDAACAYQAALADVEVKP